MKAAALKVKKGAKLIKGGARRAGAGTYIALVFCSLFVVCPFYILVISSLKTSYEINYMPFSLWPRNGFSLEGYKRVLFTGDLIGATLFDGLLNTLIVAVPTVLVGLFVSLLAAYGFAKLEFKGRDTLFGILMLNMMIPGSITMISSYTIYDMIGWVDTFLPLIVPSLFGGIGTIFFLKQYLKGLPNDIIEAAKIDGAGHGNIFCYIIIPLSVPSLIAFGLINFLGKYNDYLGPLLYLQSPERYTLQIVLAFLQDDRSNWSAVLAGSVLSLAPMLAVYVIFQKYMLKGISMASGLKA